jgi:hypothetical protein
VSAPAWPLSDCSALRRPHSASNMPLTFARVLVREINLHLDTRKLDLMRTPLYDTSILNRSNIYIYFESDDACNSS